MAKISKVARFTAGKMLPQIIVNRSFREAEKAVDNFISNHTVDEVNMVDKRILHGDDSFFVFTNDKKFNDYLRTHTHFHERERNQDPYIDSDGTKYKILFELLGYWAIPDKYCSDKKYQEYEMFCAGVPLVFSKELQNSLNSYGINTVTWRQYWNYE